MEVIKRQKWEKLFKRRELVHVDVVKEFYAKLTMSHNRKKDVARSKVRGVEIEFDHMKLASILGIPGNNGICEYIKEVWEESRYTKPLKITRKFANDETIMEDTFLTMCKLTRENGVWWISSERIEEGMMRSSSNQEVHEEDEARNDFDREVVIDEATASGESGSMIGSSMLKWKSRTKD
ncbi:hypothetical protein Dimus_013151 [Dionaea muscipula]